MSQSTKITETKVMNEQVKKIDEAILAEIRLLKGKFEELTFKLGNLQVEKMELDQFITNFVEREKKLKEEWASIKKLDEELRDKIVAKYGEGRLDPDNGTFIPDPSAIEPRV